jgi:activator of HSP90 ATPase
MAPRKLTRRDISIGTGSFVAAIFAAAPALGAAHQSRSVGGDTSAEISRNNAAIHQEIFFSASVARVYAALTVAEQFDKVIRLSAAMDSDMKKALGSTPTEIDAKPGGAFSLFGGYVTGRMLDLVANERIVQAWRAGSWDAGLHSIARYVLLQHRDGTRLVFDHTGFPNAAARHLAEGWHGNYWVPLAKVLA